MVLNRRWKLSQLAAFSHAQDHLKVQTVGGGIGERLGTEGACALAVALPLHGILSPVSSMHCRRCLSTVDCCCFPTLPPLPPPLLRLTATPVPHCRCTQSHSWACVWRSYCSSQRPGSACLCGECRRCAAGLVAGLQLGARRSAARGGQGGSTRMSSLLPSPTVACTPFLLPTPTLHPADERGRCERRGLARHLQPHVPGSSLRGAAVGCGGRQRQVADREQAGGGTVRDSRLCGTRLCAFVVPGGMSVAAAPTGRRRASVLSPRAQRLWGVLALALTREMQERPAGCLS